MIKGGKCNTSVRCAKVLKVSEVIKIELECEFVHAHILHNKNTPETILAFEKFPTTLPIAINNYLKACYKSF